MKKQNMQHLQEGLRKYTKNIIIREPDTLVTQAEAERWFVGKEIDGYVCKSVKIGYENDKILFDLELVPVQGLITFKTELTQDLSKSTDEQ